MFLGQPPGADQDTPEDQPMPSSPPRFFSFILERKNALCHNTCASLMMVCVVQNCPVTLFLQGQRGFLLFLMVDGWGIGI